MSRTVWSIIIIGFLAIVFLVVAMLVTLGTFSKSPYSSATKLALMIKNEFHFESVGTALQPQATAEGMKNYLLIGYETHADSKFDSVAQTNEMRRVAQFSLEKSDPIERKRIEEVRVHRTEVRGTGCFQHTYVADHALPNPFRAPAPGGTLRQP